MFLEIPYNMFAKDALENLQKGAFLSTKSRDKQNTMTIAWGNIGFMWKKPVFTAMVRYSRHTYEMLKESNEFTVSIPLDDKMKEAIGICGKTSGRDVNKFEEANITPKRGIKVESPLIEECGLHYECKVICSQPLDMAKMTEDVSNCYKDGNYHVLFYGEIVGTYMKK